MPNVSSLQDNIVDELTVGLRPGPALLKPIEFICAVLLVGIVGLLLMSVTSRYLFSSPMIWVDEAAAILFLWLAMLGSAVAIGRGEHLRLTLFVGFLPQRIQRFTVAFGPVLVATFLLTILWPAVMHVAEESFIISPTLGISVGWRASALPVGIALMLVLVLRDVIKSASVSDIMVSIAVVGVSVLTLWLVAPWLMDLGYTNILIFLVGFVALFLIIGVPIAFCFGLGALAFITFTSSAPINVVVGRMDEGMSALILISVPIFVLLGCVLDATGMGKAIVEFIASLFGHVRAGMSYVLLGSLFLVSGISGSKVSDMATVAPALFPEMKRRGHKPKDMIALLATGAAMADTVPPSIVLIVLGSVAGVSISGLFTAGFAIAMVLLLVLAILARWKARHEIMDNVKRAPARVIAKSAIFAAPALVLPFLIRSAVGGGVATATEVSTIAVLYAFVIGMTLYGGLSITKIYSMLVETAALSGAILLILGTASSVAWALTQTGFSYEIATLVSNLPGGSFSFLLVTIALFLVIGCVLEGLPAVVLLAPIMYPIARSLGINDIHYSMVVVVAMNIGLMAPPIGIGFYIACKIGNVNPDEAMGAIWPYIGALLVGLLIIAAVPALSTFYL